MKIAHLFLPLAMVGLPLAPAYGQDLAVETAKVEDLSSIRAIKYLQSRWGHLALSGDWQGMAALTTQDAALRLPYGEIEGRGGIEAWLRQTQGHGTDGMPAGRMNIRLYISPVITLAPDGQSATGRWHEIAMTAEIGEGADWLGATHIVDYRKTPAGWRIAGVRPYAHFSGSYAEGWSHDAKTLERAPYHYTPDEAGTLLPTRRARSAQSEDALDHRATLMLDQSHALNIVSAYGYYLDRGLYDDIVDLFADDAVIEQAGDGSWQGSDGVRAFLMRYGAPGLDEGELNDRPQLMPMAEISDDGSTALIRNIEIGMTGQHGEEGYWSATLQTFLLRRGDDNKWRIASLHHSPIMRAGYEEGWASPLPAALPDAPQAAPTGTTTLKSADFRTHSLSVPPMGPEWIMPATVPGATQAPIPNALAKAEAFDGAENVSNAYGYYIDQFAWRQTAALFARDGWKELSYIGTFVGKDRVLASLIQRYGEGGPNDAFQAIHQKTQPYVTVLDNGRRAFIRTRLFQFNSADGAAGSWISGIYENQIIKEDGIWRIQGMDLDYIWLGDYDTGWTGIDPAASSRFGPDKAEIEAFAPDSPLRGETFAPYPHIAPLGWHFANPVSGRKPEVLLEWSDGHRFPTAP
ncbi:nuclear transport factor 2 family protein [Altericroceibacterium endophyticum]|uniref:Nuclear transport factor 2 family protein n=1 Tax=Altericroceibacterium endophyticum TaxID=1808508 RepID=A0A6I4T8I9_9SPHN|nr:nuclear transport factor 2 family protein [Altericroceibacterium endophyticum]MXO67107.1 nuclear transport factor 2 family protein [Altericroceibacterium endophyticum]